MKTLKIIAGILLFIVIVAFLWIRQINQEMDQIDIGQVSFHHLADGEYSGTFSHGPITAQTLTHIQDGKITDIKLVRHDHGLGSKAEMIIEDVVEQQSLQVDTVSGAAGSSKVILKSIEQAFNKEGA